MVDLYVLDENMDSVAVLDSYKSKIWTDRFRECGDFELVVSADPEISSCLKPDYYLWSAHSDRMMIIEEIVTTTDPEEGDEITLTGRSLESILDRRIVWGLRTLSGNFQNEMEALFNENIIAPSKEERRIDNFIFEKSDDPAITNLKIEAQYIGTSLYDIVTEKCLEYGIGFKITVNDAKQFVFQFYAGTDRSYNQIENPWVVFSPEFNNLLGSKYSNIKTDFKNVALVGGEGEGTERKYTAVGNYTGLNRREMFTDAGGVSSSSGVDISESFNFSQYPFEVFNVVTKTFVSEPNFNSCMVNVKAYAGTNISISIPKYTDANGSYSKNALILVSEDKAYISTLMIWEGDDNYSPDTEEPKAKGSLETYTISLPTDAAYIYASMYSIIATVNEVYSGEITDFECSVTKMSNGDYIRLLREKGKSDLSEATEMVSFEGEIEGRMSFVYAKDFFMGDIVQVENEYGDQVISRVSEFILSEDEGGTSMYPTFETITVVDEPDLLPEGYTECEYIESDGTQYLNSLFIPNDNTRIVLDIEILGSSTAPIFGSRDTESFNMFALWVIDGTTVRYNYGEQSKSQTIDSVLGRFEIMADRETCTFGDTTFISVTDTFDCANSLMILAIISNGVVDSRLMEARLYSCRIYDDETLVRNFVPCINPSDLAGMYDLIEGRFYASSGLGDFTAKQKEVETA